jgi:phosphoglycerate kinase
MTIKKMTDLNLKGKRVLIREDLNVPLKNGEISSDLRIQAAIPTLEYALKSGATVIVMSHLGRPTEGVFSSENSLAVVAQRLSELLKMPVPLIQNWVDGFDMGKNKIVLLENVRFNKGEKDNNETLSQKMAELCDVYVMDAFATAHRAEASTCGVAKFAKVACAGPLLMQELETIERALEKPEHPVVAVVGGSKVSTKLALLDRLVRKVDYLIIGGGIANTFIAAEGHPVGKSLYEPDLIDEAERIMAYAKQHNVSIPVPTDVVVADRVADDAESYEKPASQVDEDEKIFDIGPETVKVYEKILKQAKTIFWNGPVGLFECKLFAKGTEAIARAIADSKAFSIAGGGDTLAAIDSYNIADKISYVSTGGGAFLALLEGTPLPAVEALKGN